MSKKGNAVNSWIKNIKTTKKAEKKVGNKTSTDFVSPELVPQSRAYQEYILNRLKVIQSSKKNIILELDCGLGKRFLLWKLLQPGTERTLVLLDSSSSLSETSMYMKSFGNVSLDVATIDSRTSHYNRVRLLKGTQHVLMLPQTLENILRKEESLELSHNFKILVINEVDKIVRRIGYQDHTLILPWRKLLPRFDHACIIGMSGTLRDNHVVVHDLEQVQIREELNTLTKFINNAEIMQMDEFYTTDIDDFVQITELSVLQIISPVIAEIAKTLSVEIRKTVRLIIEDLRERHPAALEYIDAEKESRKLFALQDYAREDLAARHTQLSLLRKYLYAMPARQVFRHLNNSKISQVISGAKKLKDPSEKTQVSLKLCSEAKKSVILCSYISTINSIEVTCKTLYPSIRVFKLTGKSNHRERQDQLLRFKQEKEKSIMLISPVGERDLDFPQAELLILYDLINSIKTVYQKIKRTRGGRVVVLSYSETSEVHKAERVTNSLLESYPWSTRKI